MNVRWIDMTGVIVAIAVLCLPAIAASELPAAPGVLVIDDFESYSDEEGNRICETGIEWRVPLSKLVGVNFSKVRQFCLGVGDRANPKPGGSGRIYIGDIRVVRPAPAEQLWALKGVHACELGFPQP